MPDPNEDLDAGEDAQISAALGEQPMSAVNVAGPRPYDTSGVSVPPPPAPPPPASPPATWNGSLPNQFGAPLPPRVIPAPPPDATPPVKPAAGAPVAWNPGAAGGSSLPVAPHTASGGKMIPGQNVATVDPKIAAQVAQANAAKAEADKAIGGGQADAQISGAATHAAKADELSEEAKADASRIAERKGDMRSDIARLQAKIDKASSMGIDPARLTKNMSPGQTFAYGIAAALAGASAGFNHQTGNSFLESQERTRAADIDAQKEAIANARAGVGDYRDQLALKSKELDKLSDAEDRVGGKKLAAVTEAGAGNEGTFASRIAAASGDKSVAEDQKEGAFDQAKFNKWVPAHAGAAGGLTDAQKKELFSAASDLQRQAQENGHPLTEQQAADQVLKRFYAINGTRQTGDTPLDYSKAPAAGKNGKIVPPPNPIAVATATGEGVGQDGKPTGVPSAGVGAPGWDSFVNPITRHFGGTEAGHAVAAQEESNAAFEVAVRQASAQSGRPLQPGAIKEAFESATINPGDSPATIENKLNLRKSILAGFTPASAPTAAPPDFEKF